METHLVWCKQSFPKKEKKSKNKNFKNGEIKKWDFCHIRVRVCAREKAKNAVKGMFLCMYDAVECRKMPNLPLFSVSGGFLLCLWTIYPPCLRKRLSGLKNGFCVF